MKQRADRAELSADAAVRMARIATISPPPPGYLESLPERALERFERDRRRRLHRYTGAGLAAALALACYALFGVQDWRGADNAPLNAEAPTRAPTQTQTKAKPPAVIAVALFPAKASPRVLDSGGTERAASSSYRKGPRALEGAAVESMERADPASAEPEEPPALEWPSEEPATAERLVASLERAHASFALGRRSMLRIQDDDSGSFEPLLYRSMSASSPTDEVRLPQ